MSDSSVVLRHHRDDFGTRYLAASLAPDGRLTIEGQDIGKEVEKFFGGGLSEYEWTWTIQPHNVAQLISALDGDANVLSALAKRFSNDAAGGLKEFLDSQEIPYECWSRVGD